MINRVVVLAQVFFPTAMLKTILKVMVKARQEGGSAGIVKRNP